MGVKNVTNQPTNEPTNERTDKAFLGVGFTNFAVGEITQVIYSLGMY